jgi:chloramphenicol O-acetyltransferase type A
MKTYIDMENYPRRSHFDYFRSLAYPYVGFTANVDVTNLIRYAKERQASSFLAILWVAAQAANAVPELRQDIEGDCIVQYDYCDIGHTVALPDHTFCNCHTTVQMPLDEYLVYAKEQQEEAKLHPGFVNQDVPENGMIFASCVPWVAFTQCIQPVPIPADCNPRIVFGKFIKEGGRTLMPLHIQCNHALVDGYHLGLFYHEFEKITASL